MGNHASFWDNPGQGDDTPVIRHAPDTQNYHYPDRDQVSKMRGSKVGAFVIIPAANKDGTSKGFDADEPGVVHVDPDAPDGGAIVDLSQVSQRDMNTALSQSVYPHQVFYRLGMPALLYKHGAAYERPSMSEPPRVNPVLPGTYVVPKAADNGVQMPIGGMTPAPGYNPQFAHAQEEPRVIPNQLGQPPQLQIPQQSAQPVQAPAPSQQPMAQPMAQPMQPMQPQVPPQYAGYQQGYAHPGMLTPPPMDPHMQSMLLQLTQTVQGLSAQVQQMQHQKHAEVGGPVRAPQLATAPVGAPHNAMTAPPPNLYPIGQGPKRKKHRDDDDDGVFQDDAAPIGRRPDHDPNAPLVQNSMVRREQQKQRLRDYQQAQQDDEPGPTNALITGFETLKMPFVTGPLPHKAKRQVFFEFEGIGKQSARYHDVIESDHCVALVYDTRYEDGTQYLPPDLGEKEIRLHVPHLKKTFTVSSMGFTYACGVLDHIVLVKHDEESLDINDN